MVFFKIQLKYVKVIFQSIAFNTLLITTFKIYVHGISGFDRSNYSEGYPFIVFMFVFIEFFKFVW